MTESAQAVVLEAQQLMHRLFYCLDIRDYEGVASCFADDGVWLRQGKRLVGRKAMLDALGERSATMTIHHIITNILVENSASARPTVRGYLTVYRHDSGVAMQPPLPLAGPSQVGPWQGEMVRGPAGWRLASLESPPPVFKTA